MTDQTMTVTEADPQAVKRHIIAAIRRVDDGPERGAWALAEAITEDLEAIGVDADIDRVTKLIESVSGWDEIGADELADELSEAAAR